MYFILFSLSIIPIFGLTLNSLPVILVTSLIFDVPKVTKLSAFARRVFVATTYIHRFSCASLFTFSGKKLNSTGDLVLLLNASDVSPIKRTLQYMSVGYIFRRITTIFLSIHNLFLKLSRVVPDQYYLILA